MSISKKVNTIGENNIYKKFYDEADLDQIRRAIGIISASKKDNTIGENNIYKKFYKADLDQIRRAIGIISSSKKDNTLGRIIYIRSSTTKQTSTKSAEQSVYRVPPKR